MLMNAEITRIENFIKNYVREEEKVVIMVSGGLDSDVTARLCCRALGRERIRLCMVIQSEMEQKFHKQAVELAQDLGVRLAEVHLENINRVLTGALEQGEPEVFRLNTLLDPAKAKCSLRSAVISCYQDKGYIIAGTTNKTEKLLGFFLTFGDNLANFKPLAHLYRTQVIKIAEKIGTAPDVIRQEASAGFWEGQTDAEDLAYWIINRGPILTPREFSDEEIALAQAMIPELTPDNIDAVLAMYEADEGVEATMGKTRVSKAVVEGLFNVADKAPVYKTRRIMVEMEEGW